MPTIAFLITQHATSEVAMVEVKMAAELSMNIFSSGMASKLLVFLVEPAQVGRARVGVEPVEAHAVEHAAPSPPSGPRSPL